MPKPLQKIYILFGLISLFIAALFLFFYAQKILPYRLVLYKGQKDVIDANTRFFYSDLNTDGYEERIILINEMPKKFYYIKIYQDYRNGLLDQFNFNNPLIGRSLTFFDANDDGWNDVFVFSHNDEALYLSIIDVKRQTFIQKEVPIVPSSPKRTRKHWDIHSVYPEVVDLKGDGNPLLLFALNSGYARLPRCLCLYDFKRHKIIRRFDHHFGPIKPILADLNHDGLKEIFLFNYATNNFPENIPLSDAYSWYIVLGHTLHFLRPPIRLGKKFSLVNFYPANDLSFLGSYGSNSLNTVMCIDSTYEIKKSKKINRLRSAIAYQSETDAFLYVTSDVASAEIFDPNLNLLKKIRLPEEQENLIVGLLKNVVGSPQPELLCWNTEGFFLYDLNWKLIAKYTFKKNASINDIYPIRQPDITNALITFTRGNTRYKLMPIPNPYSGKLIGLFLTVFILTFLIFIFGFHTLKNIWRYVSSFSYLLKKSDNAIILLNYKGRVISVNKKVNHFLKLSVPLRKGDYYQTHLKQRPEIIEAIQTCEKNLQQTQKTFSFDDPLGTFIGEVTVTPFLTLFKFVYAYLVEIKDSTEHVLAERQLNWQRNIRRMVHDIKTPLAGVQLKLQMLFMKLSEEYPNLKENVFNELEDAYSELKRIRNISKDFLKFSDLEKPKIEGIAIEQFIDNALTPFQLYNNEFMHIEIKIDSGVPKTVYWDKRQIEILLHIIIENSIDALQGKGEIIVEVRPSPEIRDEELPWIEFRIQDNGPGIPEEIQSKIFEPHFSTKKEGSGLGLSFAKHIVEQHHGKISFFSTPNAGTVFIVLLPAHFA